MKTGGHVPRPWCGKDKHREGCGAGHAPGRVAGDAEACRQGWCKQGLVGHAKEPKLSKCVGSE